MKMHFTKVMKLAKEFISKKNRKAYYKFTLLWELNLDEELVVYNYLDEEQIAALKELKAKYGDKEYVNHLEEVFTDEDELLDIKSGQEFVSDIDLETKYYKYEFMVHELYSDGTIKSKSLLIELNDDEYAELLAWRLHDQRFTLNTLKFANNKLYEKIMWIVDASFGDDEGLYMPCCDAPYLATMDEVNRDVEEMLKEYPQYRSGATLRCYGSFM